MSRRLVAMVAVALSAGLGAGACASSSARRGAPLPRAAPVIEVALREYRFGYDQQVPAGRVVFRFSNAGKVPHRPALVALPEDLPPIEDQLRGEVRRSLPPFAGVRTRLPGRTGAFAVDLAPGRRYALVCFFRGDDGQSHAVKGMASEFRTPGSPATAPSGP